MLQKTYRLRLKFLYLVPIFCFCALAPRLYFLQVIKRSYYAERADAQHRRTKKMAPTRGKILDADGNELAGSVNVYVPYVNPSLVLGRGTAHEEEGTSRARALAGEIVRLTRADYAAVYKALTARGYARKIPVDLSETQRLELQEIFRLYRKSIPARALWFEELTRRRYPRGELASHVIGFTVEDETGDNKGIAGVERIYDQELRGSVVEVRARTNAQGIFMEPVPDKQLQATYGHTVVLTINEAIQEAAERALARHVLEHRADAGIAIVYHVKTGAVLAMASMPTYDLANLRISGEEGRRNRVIANAIEPGSVMKIFTFASLFEQGKASPDDLIDCGGGSYAIAGRIIKDVHAIGTASIRKIFEQSSNVGTIKAAQRLTPSRFRRHLAQFGFGDKTGIDLPGETEGVLRPVSRWSGLSMSSIPMGYELTVSGIQVAAAAGALGNQGIYMQPHVVKEIRDVQGNVIRKFEPQPLRRVASPTTCRHMLAMMEQVVATGTGKSAQVPGYRIGGKTGTTKKLDPVIKKYTMKNYIASFCGLAPISDPEVCIYTYIDNPKGASYYGGSVAAPVFRDIAAAAMKALHIPPDAETADPSAVPTTSTRYIVMDHIKASLESRIPMAYLGRTTPRDRVSSGSMPDLEGLTMKEVQEKLLARGIPFEFSGTGVVVDQTPRAYETLEEGVVARITFGPESLLLQRVAATARAAGALPDPFEDEEGEDLARRMAAEGALEEAGGSAGESGLTLVGRRGTVSLPLAETDQEVPERVSPPPRALSVDALLPATVPDVDPYAATPPAPSGGRNAWAEYEKELKRRKEAEGNAAPERGRTTGRSAGR